MYFPLFLMKSGRKRSVHSRRQFIQCFLTGAAFRQRPLSPLTSQCSCRDKNIASGGTRAEIFMKYGNIRTGFHTELFALIRLALAGDARATFPQGKAKGTDCDQRESL